MQCLGNVIIVRIKFKTIFDFDDVFRSYHPYRTGASLCLT